MIDPSTIDVSVLPSVGLDDRSSLPQLSGIYFVLDAFNEVLYIGRTSNFWQRWKQHSKLKDFRGLVHTKIAWLGISDIDLLPRLEEALIAHFQPLLNRSSNGGGVKTITRCNRDSWVKAFEDSGKPWMFFTGYRLSLGVSQKDLGKLLGLSDQTISNWENGKAVPRLTPGKMLQLCQQLNCSLEDLVRAFPEESN